MKRLEKICQEAMESVKRENEEKFVAYYMDKLKEDIGDDKCKMLVYKNACKKEMESSLPSFLVSVCAIFLSLVSIVLAIISINGVEIQKVQTSLDILVSGSIGVTMIVTVKYMLTCIDQKKYTLISLVLEQIEKDMD